MKAKLICAWCTNRIPWAPPYRGDPIYGICQHCLETRFPAILDLALQHARQTRRRKIRARTARIVARRPCRSITKWEDD